jgi:hypothetical protein
VGEGMAAYLVAAEKSLLSREGYLIWESCHISFSRTSSISGSVESD